jgi:superfamily II DNA or RNA helicase
MIYSQKLSNALVSISPYKLREIAGEKLVETATTLNENASSLRGIVELIKELHEPQKFVINIKFRQYIIETLSQNEALDLAKEFNYDGLGTSWNFLINLGNTQAIKNKFFNYFDIQIETDTKVSSDEFISIKAIKPNYQLYDYQNHAVSKSIKILSKAEKNNVLIHMPTGSGKTRTAMHLISRVLNKRLGKVVVWLAHSEELCEQAAEEFEKSWKSLGNREISVGRYFDKGKIDLANFNEGIIIAGLSKLYKRSISEQQAFLQMQQNVTLIVFDEAHQATAETYKHLVNMLTIGGNRVNLVGLTATPGRSSLQPEETEELANIFNRNKITLAIDGFPNPIDFLISKGYLAKPNYTYFKFKSDDMYVTDALAKRLDSGKDFDTQTLQNIGVDINRNLLILEMVDKLIKKHKKIIIFSSSVEHAHLISSILKLEDYHAKAITSDNSTMHRKETIASFKSDEKESLNIIVNFGILTTGFDAPKASAAIIARPTQSVALYSQMVGRVLRGPESNGTKECEVFTIVDEIEGFRSIYEGFNHWDEFWD